MLALFAYLNTANGSLIELVLANVQTLAACSIVKLPRQKAGYLL
jgi:hypothetical protein